MTVFHTGLLLYYFFYKSLECIVTEYVYLVLRYFDRDLLL